MAESPDSEPSLDLSLVIACYNEERLLRQSVKEIVEVLDNTRCSYELIFVDDCSQDSTEQIIQELISEISPRPARCILHETNMGRGTAVRDGFLVARGEIVGYIDIDLEVHARYIPSCLSLARNSADVVIARRVYKFSLRRLMRWFASKTYHRLVMRVLHLPDFDTETGFKFFRREKLLPVLEQTRSAHWFWDTEIMARSFWAGLTILEVPCLFIARAEKQSTVKLFRDSCRYLIDLWRFRKNTPEERK